MKLQDFDSTIIKAVKEDDVYTLHSRLCTEINLDPRFEKDGFEDLLNVIKESGVKIDEPYEKQKGEYNLPRSQWTDLYFYGLTEWLRKNFAPAERIPHIKEVGRAVFPEKKQAEPDFPKAPQGQSDPQKTGQSSGKAAPRKKTGTVAAAIAAAAALIALVALIIKLLK